MVALKYVTCIVLRTEIEHVGLWSCRSFFCVCVCMLQFNAQRSINCSGTVLYWVNISWLLVMCVAFGISKMQKQSLVLASHSFCFGRILPDFTIPICSFSNLDISASNFFQKKVNSSHIVQFVCAWTFSSYKCFRCCHSLARVNWVQIIRVKTDSEEY